MKVIPVRRFGSKRALKSVRQHLLQHRSGIAKDFTSAESVKRVLEESRRYRDAGHPKRREMSVEARRDPVILDEEEDPAG
jgi:hypothetical protein